MEGTDADSVLMQDLWDRTGQENILNLHVCYATLHSFGLLHNRLHDPFDGRLKCLCHHLLECLWRGVHLWLLLKQDHAGDVVHLPVGLTSIV